MRRYSAVYLMSLNRRDADPFSGCYIASKWDAFLLWPGRASFSLFGSVNKSRSLSLKCFRKYIIT